MTNTLRRAFLTSATAALAIAGLGTAASAQDYTKDTLHLVVPYGPGGGTDLTARIVADEMTKRWGWNVVVDNKPGAASQVGISYVARAKPDGTTILWSSADGIVVIPGVQEEVPYKMPDDFEFITTFASFPLVLGVRADFPANTVQEFFEYAKAHPGEVTYSSSGAGGGGHLHPAAMAVDLGLDMLHVPYDGAGPAAVAVAGGHVDATNIAPSSAGAYVQDGTMRILATSGENRSEMYPDAPTLAEAGYPQFTLDFFYGMYAPAGTPEEAITQLRNAVEEIRSDPAVVEGLKAKGLAPFVRNGDEFRSFVVGQIDRWRKVAEAIDFKP